MKKNFTRQALPAVAMLMVASLSLVGTTYAWFTQNDTAKVTDINVKVTDAAGGIAVSSTLGGTYATSFAHGNTATKIEPVSTNGAITTPEGDLSDGATRTERTLSWFIGTVDKTDATKLSKVEADSVGNYVKLDVYVENLNTKAQDIYLNYASYLATSDGMFADPTKTATYASRIAFVVQGNKESKTTATWEKDDSTQAVIVEPNELNHLSSLDSSITGATSKIDYYALIATNSATHVIKPTADDTYMKKATTYSVDSCNTNSLGESATAADWAAKQVLFTVQPGYTWVTVYVWLEGQDCDCLNSISAQDLTINLVFRSHEHPAA